MIILKSIVQQYSIGSTQMLAYISIAIGLVFLVLYFIFGKKEQVVASSSSKTKQPEEEKDEHFGRVRIYFGSQTGTASKLAEQLSEEATEHHFSPEVIDLKDINITHFEAINEISLFLLSNTGEGDPPQNTIKFMNILKGKQSIDEVKDIQWKNIRYSIFGLGNTQYEHYNKTGIDVDKLLEKKGATRIYKLGLGDDNCSLEDDYSEWKKSLWPALKNFRRNNPLEEKKEEKVEKKIIRKMSFEDQENNQLFLSKIQPQYANFKLFFLKRKDEKFEWKQQQLDFKTKASLKAVSGVVRSVKQLRQNEEDGSTLQIEVQLPNQPEYQTAGNIALYGKNDGQIIQQILLYFGFKLEDLDRRIGLQKINEEKKLKLNFVPQTLRTLLEDSIDIQGRLTKAVLKKLSKFQSKNPAYFIQNSSKTTRQFERITDQQVWCYLFQLIKEHQVKLAFEDFIELSDSMAPRLFTIASHAKTQKNVIVAASLVQKGLISKHFLRNPKQFRAQLRKSTFSDAMKWKKVIFVAAGTGLAPFRAFIQEKVFLLKRIEEGANLTVPIISLFFGCKHEEGDFIYKDQILGWRDKNIINRLHLAFSRDSQKKVYVQDLLKREEAEVKQLGLCEETAIYLCGSLPMGKSIIEVLTQAFGAEKVKEMQQKGRIVKQLW